MSIHKFIKKAGLKSEEEFYNKYPNEEAFFNDYPEMRGGGKVDFTPIIDNFPEAKSGIKIKKSHRGKFTAWAKKHGMSVQEAASHVLANKDKYSTSVVKQASFAHTFGGRNYEDGGLVPEFYLGAAATGFNLLGMLAENNRVGHAEQQDYIDSIQPQPVVNTNFSGGDLPPAYYQKGGQTMSDDDLYTNYYNQFKSQNQKDPVRLANIMVLSHKYNVPPSQIFTNTQHPVNGSQIKYRDYQIFDNDGKLLADLQDTVGGGQVGSDGNAPPAKGLNPVEEAFATSYNRKRTGFKYKKAYGGNIPSAGGLPKGKSSRGDVEAEAGEAYQDQEGNIMYLDPSMPNTENHEEGGADISNAFRVLEATSTKKGRNDFGDRVLKLDPNTVKELTGFKPKGVNSHAGALMKADEFYSNKRKKYDRVLDKQLKAKSHDPISLNTAELNLKFRYELPSKEKLFDKLFNHQENIKARYGVAEYGNKAQRGLIRFAEEFPKLLKTAPSGPGGPIVPRTPVDLVPAAPGGPLMPNTPRGLAKYYPLNTIFDVIAGTTPIPGERKVSYKLPIEADKKLNDWVDNHPAARDAFTMYLPGPSKLPKMYPIPWIEDLTGLNKVYGDGNIKMGPDKNPKELLDSPVKLSAPKITPPETVPLAPMPQGVAQATTTSTKDKGPKYNFPVKWTDVASPVLSLLEPKGREYYNPVDLQTTDFRRLDPTAALNANQSTFRNATRTLPNNSIGRAVASNLFAKKYQADQQVISQYDNANAEISNREAAYNNEVLNKEALINQRARQMFSNAMERRDAAYSENRLNALDAIGSVYAKNRAFNFNTNLLQSLAPYMELNPETQQVEWNGKKLPVH